MIFEVPLADHQLVYLRGESTIEDPIIWVTVKGFWKIWAPHQRDGRKPDSWYHPKYTLAQTSFIQSKEYPVPVPQAGDPIKINGRWLLTMRDGATRIQWLADHGATSFPLGVSATGRSIIAATAGVKSI